uniref:Uncharacterized protein n=1 Tax=Arundo donax TaxID=35708 RepID=A0A0A9GYE9_ARUDO
MGAWRRRGGRAPASTRGGGRRQ